MAITGGEEGGRKGGRLMAEEQRLIQTGLLTPFGSSVQALASSSLTGESSSSSSTVTSREPEVSSKPVSSEKEPSIRLCSSSFDGLFSSGSVDAGRKPPRRIARIPKKKKGNTSTEQSQTSRESAEVNSHSTALETSMEMVPSDHEDWIPSLADLLESNSSRSSSIESEYFTDEELGGTQKKRKRKLRALSSDDLSDEDELRSAKKRRRRRTTQQTRYNDDGDKELYQQRLR